LILLRTYAKLSQLGVPTKAVLEHRILANDGNNDAGAVLRKFYY